MAALATDVVMFGADPKTWSSQSSSKVVLYPQGHPAGNARQVCDTLVHFCGGDAQRTFDLKRNTIEESLQHALRIRAFQDDRRPALCVVHRTLALSETLQLRSLFEADLAIARTAVWALYWDAALDENFLNLAQSRGDLIGEITEGAVWRHASGAEFLILSPFVDDYAALADEASMLAFSRRPKSARTRSGPSFPAAEKLAS